MARDIIQTWYFEQPPEVVWEYLTNPDLLAQWLMKNNFRAEQGYEFTFNTEPKVKIGFDGIVHCKVLELVPCSLLSYSWKGGPGNGRITLDTIVTWTLLSHDGGTKLVLEHKGFEGMRNYIAYVVMGKGWGGRIRNRLKDLMNAVST